MRIYKNHKTIYIWIDHWFHKKPTQKRANTLVIHQYIGVIEHKHTIVYVNLIQSEWFVSLLHMSDTSSQYPAIQLLFALFDCFCRFILSFFCCCIHFFHHRISGRPKLSDSFCCNHKTRTSFEMLFFFSFWTTYNNNYFLITAICVMCIMYIPFSLFQSLFFFRRFFFYCFMLISLYCKIY